VLGHVSAARPPEGDDAPPRGAANEVSLGASFQFSITRFNAAPTRAGPGK
jgi:hypothetical protein